MSARKITLNINGRAVEAEVDVRVNLADFLRHGIGLTGTHVGCEHGVCGACTVLVDGKSARRCLMLHAQARALPISTVEGLAHDGKLNSLQEAFTTHHGVQCGYCTPGILMTLTELLR